MTGAQDLKSFLDEFDKDPAIAKRLPKAREQAKAALDALDEIQSLRQRVERLEKYARDISKAITGLTIGAGSEWFKPVGDEYYVDPDFAAHRLGEMLDKGRDARKQLARAALSPKVQEGE